MGRWLRCLGKTVAVLAVIGIGLIVLASYAPETIRAGLGKISEVASLGSNLLTPDLPAERRVEKCKWLPQNWSQEDSAWFHNVSQGTATFPVPYAWFMKLERPELSLLDPLMARPLISDPDYLARLGFIPPNPNCDPPATASLPKGYGTLPVGFAVLTGRKDPTTGPTRWKDPTTGQTQEDALGLTCAACHTGQILYGGTTLRIDGAPAMINLEKLERVMGLSICYAAADWAPWRRHRFVESLLEDRPDLTDAEQSAEKSKNVEKLLDICKNEITGKIKAEAAILKLRHEGHAEEGFGRLDALNRIGNQVFNEDLTYHDDPANPDKPPVGWEAEAIKSNFAARSAPVSFPQIWDVPHFAWAQYDASILNPDIRNMGEAMGVGAKINMLEADDPARPLFGSTVDVAVIRKIETLLAGESPFSEPVGFKGLQAPKWDDAAKEFPGDKKWQVDVEKVKAGRRLYRAMCFECHRGPVRDPEIPVDDVDSFWTEQNSDQVDKPQTEWNWVSFGGEKFFNVVQKTVNAIGTDPEQARVLTERKVRLPAYLGIDVVRDILGHCRLEGDATLKTSFALNLMAAVARVKDEGVKRLEQEGQALPPGSKLPNCPNPRVFLPMVAKPVGDQAASSAVRYLLKPHYRARPLDGVWATAPYLHNGSVPTLDDLLTPQDERPNAFCVGPIDFDPVKVGLSKDPENADSCALGLTRFDTSLRGNSNRGHSFEAEPGAPLPGGVIGRKLNDEERSALIEYLKTL